MVKKTLLYYKLTHYAVGTWLRVYRSALHALRYALTDTAGMLEN